MKIEGTRLESDDEVRQAMLRYRPAAQRAEAPSPRQPAPADDAPPLFRPTQRPATPVLTVFDDGVEEGEQIRIRTDKFVIGRSEGDLVIPHDSQISGRHMELRRTLSKEKYGWQLIDLKSTNGTYVRVGHAILQHGQVFMVGRTRLRFENQAAEEATKSATVDSVPQGTRLWQSGLHQALTPAIVEVADQEQGARVQMTAKEMWLGKDAKVCQLVLRDDPFTSARHARIFQDDEGRWVIENNKSLNGVWLKVDRLPLKGTCRFLVGEQQFMVVFPG